MGKIWKRLSISAANRPRQVRTTITAKISPTAIRRLRPEGSRLRVTSAKMLRVAKPNTSIHRML